MRICMILEGSYPYVFGGVSSWAHQYISAMPETEFILWCIGAKEQDKGKYKFKLPENVVEVHEVFLDSALRLKLDRRNQKKLRLKEEQREALIHLFSSQKVNWDVLFELFQDNDMNPVSLLMSEEFLNLLIRLCHEKYPYISFADYFYTIRSMLLPELYLLSQEVPKADIYHATATGYSGLLGSLAKWKYKTPFILTEHGIYTREREEELLRATWVPSHFRKQWIDLFYYFSICAYEHADRVTALFEEAGRIQRDIGCAAEKQVITPNGIRYENFCKIESKKSNGHIDIGAIVRIAKIKDIKTMIYAFAEVKSQIPSARLHILGDVDDNEYLEECKRLIGQLKIEDIRFTGIVDTRKYMKQLDFIILSSISEGQPLAVLESFAAGRACVTTDVGCCRELLEGRDEFGSAGICVPPMHKERLAAAMITLCRNAPMRILMGENGKKRAEKYYTHEISMSRYQKLYKEVMEQWQESALN